jgi:hypothetical protein
LAANILSSDENNGATLGTCRVCAKNDNRQSISDDHAKYSKTSTQIRGLGVYPLNKPPSYSTVQREHHLGLEHGEPLKQPLKQTVKQTANNCDILSHLIALN